MKKIYLSKNSVSNSELKKMITDLENNGYKVILSPCNEEPLNDKDSMKDRIEELINSCDLVLILVDGTCDEDVDMEIETAVLCGKKAVGVYMSGGNEEAIPNSLKKIGAGAIPCDIDKIVKITHGDNPGWLTLSGEKSSANNRIDSSDC